MALLTQYARKPLILPKKGILVDSSLVFNAPLWHPHLSLSPFTSKPPNPLVCTVTGATWGLQGRTFDGDDLIDMGAPSSVELGLKDLTILAWVRTNNTAIYPPILCKADGCNWNGYDLYIDNAGKIVVSMHDGTDSYYVTGTTDIRSASVWKFVGGVIDRDTEGNCNTFLSGVNDTASKTGTLADVGDVTFPTRTLRLGKFTIDARWWNGLMGKVLLSFRVLTLLEIQRIYLATKWRYGL